MPKAIRLLIVEDDVDLLRILCRRFLRRGFAVTAVGHPRQALEAATFKKFDVAVVDQILPEQSGAELTGHLKRLVARIQVVVLSGRTEPECEHACRAAGAYAYLCKPCRLDRLEETVRQAAADRYCLEAVPHPA